MIKIAVARRLLAFLCLSSTWFESHEEGLESISNPNFVPGMWIFKWISVLPMLWKMWRALGQRKSGGEANTSVFCVTATNLSFEHIDTGLSMMMVDFLNLGLFETSLLPLHPNALC